MQEAKPFWKTNYLVKKYTYIYVVLMFVFVSQVQNRILDNYIWEGRGVTEHSMECDKQMLSYVLNAYSPTLR